MIHSYKLGGYNIVMDVYSGSVHVVDDIVYDMLQLMDNADAKECPQTILNALSGRYEREELLTAYSEIYELQENEMLFTQDDYSHSFQSFGPGPIKALCLHIAHDCNLRCEYCFASTGDFGEGRKLMDVETGKKAIDFIIEKSAGRRNLEVDFFGGEPLMNFDAVKEIVRYARMREKEAGKNFRFTVTTNGMLLDEDKIDFINKEMSNVVLSLDGRKDVNDRMRQRVDGRGSFDTIVPKFLNLVKKRNFENYYVRGTFTKYNLDFADDVITLNDLGFDQISVEPVVCESKYPYALTESDLPAIFAEYERLAKILVDRKKEKRGFNFFHFMIDLEQGPCVIKRVRGCGCGNEYAAITPDGDVYPCHQFVGQEEWKLGSLFDGKLNEEMRNTFAKTNVYTKKECAGCWAKYYCSGGCSANNVQIEGDLLTPNPFSCELEKKRIECAVMMKAALAEDEEEAQ